MINHLFLAVNIPFSTLFSVTFIALFIFLADIALLLLSNCSAFFTDELPLVKVFKLIGGGFVSFIGRSLFWDYTGARGFKFATDFEFLECLEFQFEGGSEAGNTVKLSVFVDFIGDWGFEGGFEGDFDTLFIGESGYFVSYKVISYYLTLCCCCCSLSTISLIAITFLLWKYNSAH